MTIIRVKLLGSSYFLLGYLLAFLYCGVSIRPYLRQPQFLVSFLVFDETLSKLREGFFYLSRARISLKVMICPARGLEYPGSVET